MILLTIRSDNPTAEIGLFDGSNKLAYKAWEGHRQLAETIHHKIEAMLKSQHKQWHDIEGIVCFQGPGSFTGLRIGLTVANALTYSLTIPIVACKSNDWIAHGIKRLLAGESDQIALPEYGAPVHTTTQRK